MNPYNPERPIRLFLIKKDRSSVEITPKDIFQIKDTVVSYHLDDLMDMMSSNGIMGEQINIIDICHVYKLLYGRPFNGAKGDEPWNIWNLIKHHNNDLLFTNELRDIIYETKVLPKEEDLSLFLGKFYILIEMLWKQALQMLKKSGEIERFIALEKPINELLLLQHLQGIRISQERLQTRLSALDRNISATAQTLKNKFKMRDLSNTDEIVAVLNRHGFTVFRNQKNFLDNALDFYSEHQLLPNVIKTYRESKRDKNILLRLGAINVEKIHPVYKCLGTITGRILVDSPNLQNLKKINRDIIVPDVGKIFLYPDYSQFEPGIMAHESQDKALISDFNSGDLYASLSVALFDDLKYRESAKILFLAFCYGMKIKTMVQMAIESSGQSQVRIRKALMLFFGKYKELVKWKTRIETELLINNRIGTLLGNYRYRDMRTKHLTDAEKRWVISQRIQGTASVILKKAILEISNKLPDVDILLPMHDALLLQNHADKAAEVRNIVEKIFIDEFVKLCPSIKPRISFKDFSVIDNRKYNGLKS
jgi:DNA polymerase-1